MKQLYKVLVLENNYFDDKQLDNNKNKFSFIVIKIY